MLSKSEIRKEYLSIRNSLSINEIEDRSNVIQQKVIDIIKENKFLVIHLYLDFNKEVKTDKILQALLNLGCRVGTFVLLSKNNFTHCHITQQTKFHKNRFGIKEPVENIEFDISSCEVVIVPLVAFDTCCNRIGYGGGYYDKFFADTRLNKNCLKIGIAFECQKVDNAVSDIHDVRLNCVLTEQNEYFG